MDDEEQQAGAVQAEHDAQGGLGMECGVQEREAQAQQEDSEHDAAQPHPPTEEEVDCGYAVKHHIKDRGTVQQDQA